MQIRFENARDGVIEFRNLVGQVGRAEKVPYFFVTRPLRSGILVY